MIIVLLGPPGVGKGTQASRICSRYSIPHVSTGELLRQAVQADSKLGRQVAHYLVQGKLAPDEIVVGLVAEYLDQHPEGCLLDGFPRTIAQADALQQYLEQRGADVDVAIELRVAEDEIARRLDQRARIEGRGDDRPEAIQQRMRVYHERTQPLIDYYQQRGRLATVDGAGSPAEVFERIERIVRQVRRSA